MFRRYRWAIAAILGLFAVPWLWSRWQPERQSRAHTEKLVAAVESRNWKRLERLVADDYSDRWGHDKAVVMERVREVFAQFFVIELKAGAIDVQAADGQQVARAAVTLQGRGGPFAEMAVQRVGDLREPFTFTWRQQSWMPWDWVLTGVDQPELKVESW
jgi:hypothetical protein